MALQTVVETDERRSRRAVRAAEALDRVDGEAADVGDALRRVVAQHALAQLFPSDSRRREVAAVLEAVAEDDVHHAEGQGSVGSGTDGDVLVARVRGARAQLVDADRRRA